MKDDEDDLLSLLVPYQKEPLTLRPHASLVLLLFSSPKPQFPTFEQRLLHALRQRLPRRLTWLELEPPFDPGAVTPVVPLSGATCLAYADTGSADFAAPTVPLYGFGEGSLTVLRRFHAIVTEALSVARPPVFLEIYHFPERRRIVGVGPLGA